MDERIDKMGLQTKIVKIISTKYFYKKIIYKKILNICLFVCMILLAFSGSMIIQAEDSMNDVGELEVVIMDSPPYPPTARIGKTYAKDALPLSGAFLLDVPSSDWTYGCSATAAGMIFGYYDRIGYSNMYTGPANGGICPLDNLGQGTKTDPINTSYPASGSCHIIATEQGLDGISTSGHVDDYWISYGAPGPDPWKTMSINEGFESWPPTGWINTGWLNSSYGFAHSGDQWAFSWSAGDTLTTSTIDFNKSNIQLSFWYAAENMGNSMTLEVYIDETTLLWSNIDFTHSTYIKEIIDLSSYSGSHTISFVAQTDGFYGQMLDDIQLVMYDSEDEHQWQKCTADFLGTNQWKWDTDGGGIERNEDGATSLWMFTTPIKMYDYIPKASYGLPQTALAHGLRLFAESRGYQLVWNTSALNATAFLNDMVITYGAYEVYTQLTSVNGGEGFSYSDYKKEIDNGYPVMIQLEGHSMVGIGYDESKGKYIHFYDTWDNEVHTMLWGTSYAGMPQKAVTIIHLEPVEEPSIPFLSWYPNVQIPSGQVEMTVYDGTESYFNIHLDGIPSKQHVINGPYYGWCFEKTVPMTRNEPHPVKMDHSFDPNMQPAFLGVDWAEINYIINRDDLYPMEAVQDAIWSVIEGTTPSTSESQELVDNAKIYGSSFVPMIGDKIAVLLYLDAEDYPFDVQNTFIEVNLTYSACPLAFWLLGNDSWPSFINPDDKVGMFFDLPSAYDAFEDVSLYDMLKGSKTLGVPLETIYGELLVEAIIAMLNINHECPFYPITYDQLIVSVHDAFGSIPLVEMLEKILETYNLMGCSCVE
jgi:hypothetical protein